VERFEPAVIGVASFFALPGVNFKELMLSVTVDRFLEMTARCWARRLALESLSSADRLGMRLR
jgi:hypothetical protein